MEIKAGDIVSFKLNSQWVYLVLSVDVNDNTICTCTIGTPTDYKSKLRIGYKGRGSVSNFEFVTSPSTLESIVYGV